MLKNLITSLVVFLIIATIGAFILKGGWYTYEDSRHSGQQVSASIFSSANHPKRLLFAIALFQVGTLVCAVAFVSASRVDKLDHRPLWAQGPRGLMLFMAWLVSLLLPPLFIWQGWVTLTECVLKGMPPIAWGRIGGASTDWVIFVCLMCPLWLIAAAIGILGPPYLFWSSLFTTKPAPAKP